MINVSDEFILRAENNPNYLYTLKVTLKDGTILNLANKDIIYGGITIDEAVSEDSVLSVGAVIINSLSVLIDNRDEVFEHYNFKDAQVELTIGLTLSNDTVESFKRGTYTVVTADYNGSAIKLTCYDNIYKLEKPYIESTLVYPATVNDIVDDICELCGIELAQSVNLHFGNTIIQKNPADLTTTCRSIISYIAQINCTNAVCTPDGELNFVWYSNGFTNGIAYIRVTEDNDVRVTEDGDTRTTEVVLSEVDWQNVVSLGGFFERTLDRFDTLVTGVRIILPTDTDEGAVSRYISGSDEYLITLENNPIITEDNVNTILAYVSSILVNFYYRKGTLSHIGLPYVTAGDVAEVTDSKGQTHICLVSATTFTAGQRQRTTSSGAAPAAANGAQYSNSTKQYIKYIKGAAEATAGLFETQIVDQSTQARLIYLHNRPQLSDSDVQIKITADGVMVTANGTDTTPTWYGLTVDGNLIANILSVNGVNADWINTGALVIYDANNNEIFRADKTNRIFRWDMTHSSLSNDGKFTLIDDGGTSNPCFSVEDSRGYGQHTTVTSSGFSSYKTGHMMGVGHSGPWYWQDTTRTYGWEAPVPNLWTIFALEGSDTVSNLTINQRELEEWIYQANPGIKIGTNANMNSFTSPGNYYCISSTVAATVTNAPFTDSAFQAVVFQFGSLYCQMAWQNKQNSYVKYRLYTSNNSWGSWYAIARGAGDAAFMQSVTFTINSTNFTQTSGKAQFQRTGKIVCINLGVEAKTALTGGSTYSIGTFSIAPSATIGLYGKSGNATPQCTYISTDKNLRIIPESTLAIGTKIEVSGCYVVASN